MKPKITTESANRQADTSRSDTNSSESDLASPKTQNETPAETLVESSKETPDDQSALISAPTEKELDPTRYGDWEKNGRCIDF